MCWAGMFNFSTRGVACWRSQKPSRRGWVTTPRSHGIDHPIVVSRSASGRRKYSEVRSAGVFLPDGGLSINGPAPPISANRSAPPR